MGTPEDRNAERLQQDGRLRTVKVVAGLLSVALLAGMFVTSLYRAPAPAYTWVLAVVAIAVLAGIALSVRRWRRERR